MNIAELTQEAFRRYPVGIIFRVAHKPSIIKTILSHDTHENLVVINDGDGETHINLLTTVFGGDGEKSASVYTSKNGWADVFMPVNTIFKFDNFEEFEALAMSVMLGGETGLCPGASYGLVMFLNHSILILTRTLGRVPLEMRTSLPL